MFRSPHWPCTFLAVGHFYLSDWAAAIPASVVLVHGRAGPAGLQALHANAADGEGGEENDSDHGEYDNLANLIMRILFISSFLAQNDD